MVLVRCDGFFVLKESCLKGYEAQGTNHLAVQRWQGNEIYENEGLISTLLKEGFNGKE